MFKRSTAVSLTAVCFALFAAAWSHGAAAEGAMALGVTGNIAKDGYAIGINVNSSSQTEARDAALKYCQSHGGDAARLHVGFVLNLGDTENRFNYDSIARIGSLLDEVDAASKKLGRRLTFLVAKPGLDGHSNGAEQIAIRARDAGMTVIYDGIRFSPDDIVAVAREKKPHLIGLSILSGSHVGLARDVLAKLKDAGLGDIKVIAGGIIPPDDEATLKAAGIAAVFSPKDYDLNQIMHGLVKLAVR